MVILNIRLDNFIVFNDFSMCLSYSKKPVRSTIPEEHLTGFPNFRYKKVIVLMGANATGKTAFGNVCMGIMNFIHRREYRAIVDLIENPREKAFFSIDMAYSNGMLYRVDTEIRALPANRKEYNSEDIMVTVRREKIRKNDSYERCIERLISTEPISADNYIDALEGVPGITWYYTFSDQINLLGKTGIRRNLNILKDTLKSLDPRIIDVIKVPRSETSYIIKYPYNEEIVSNGSFSPNSKLSSGTKEGISVADVIALLKSSAIEFFYCDEKFSHIHSDVEKAFISLMVHLIGPNRQIFITTHNSDVLDLDLPKHTFAFFRRDYANPDSISCVYASEYIKKNTGDLKNAVENDVFSTAPDLSLVFSLLGSAEEIHG